MKALHIHAGPVARRHIEQHGLSPHDVRLIPAAAGGPKGLILTHLDRHLFGQWFTQSKHTMHLVGASIGAWRMAAAIMPTPAKAFERLAHDYVHQNYEPEAGRKMPSPQRISASFGQALDTFFGADTDGILAHPRWRLHVVTARGRQLLRPGTPMRTPLGFAGLALGNALSRRTVGAFLERNVFSSAGEALPVTLQDLPTARCALTAENFKPALQASCSIPFLLDAVRDIPGATTGAHWDGGLVDYHFHWNFNSMDSGLVLYPHFQQSIVPGWLDKSFKRRHLPTPGLSNMVLLAPNPAWVAKLPAGKLPDREDFTKLEFTARVRQWSAAVAESERLAHDWDDWLRRGCPIAEVRAL
ncbi:phospholipase [Aquabacterium sp.]|uniref:phospholipase n=1 Tax=Aquabacterium sp. TaxID=1872578 RepID=UPI0019B26511|nr:phospholipase [Aquabacterium sp.]MBC7699259.1 patatin-like phospholipase family protein [Aquabacterium sp.]